MNKELCEALEQVSSAKDTMLLAVRTARAESEILFASAIRTAGASQFAPTEHALLLETYLHAVADLEDQVAEVLDDLRKTKARIAEELRKAQG